MTEYLVESEALSSCPLCGSQKYRTVYKPDLCRCNHCKLYFRNPRPDQGQILACYDKGETFQQWQHELTMRSYLWNKRLSLITSYQSSGSLLDVGTGDGYFLNFASKVFDAEATEVSREGIRFAESWGHSVHHGTIFDSKFDGRKFDVITMWHVLEHVPYPAEALVRVKELLGPEGILFIAVPNEISSLYTWETLWKKRHPFGRMRADHEIHLTHFTPRVLTKALKNLFDLNVLEIKVDDVHVSGRRNKLPGMYINQVICKLFGVHVDAAMVVVCSAST